MVDLIIPTYKARDTLPKALDSLLTQTKQLFITTIVQDCDGEDYSDIIEEYRKRGLQIRYICTEENIGPGRARQYAMDTDTMCDYFMFMDSDDMLMPRAIEVLYKEAKLKNADIVISSFIAERNHQPGLYLDVDTTPVTWTHGKIYKAQYLRDNNIRFADCLRLNEDSYFNLVAVNCAKEKYKIKEVTYLWRDTPSSLTRMAGTEGFFKNSWKEYIYSQVQGLLDIERITGEIEPTLAAATINNMYNHTMEAIYHNLDVTEIIPLCQRLKGSKALNTVMQNSTFWTTIHNIVKGSQLTKNNLIFYKMRFCDWFAQFVFGRESL